MALSLQSGSLYRAGYKYLSNYSCGTTIGVFPDVNYDTMVDIYLCGILEGRYWAQNLFTGKTSKQKSTMIPTLLPSGESSSPPQESTTTTLTDLQVATLTSLAQYPVLTLAPDKIYALRVNCGDVMAYLGNSVENAILNAYYCGIKEGQYEVLSYFPNYVSNATTNYSNITKFAWVLIFATILYSIISIPI